MLTWDVHVCGQRSVWSLTTQVTAWGGLAGRTSLPRPTCEVGTPPLSHSGAGRTRGLPQSLPRALSSLGDGDFLENTLVSPLASSFAPSSFVLRPLLPASSGPAFSLSSSFSLCILFLWEKGKVATARQPQSHQTKRSEKEPEGRCGLRPESPVGGLSAGPASDTLALQFTCQGSCPSAEGKITPLLTPRGDDSREGNLETLELRPRGADPDSQGHCRAVPGLNLVTDWPH